MNPKEPADDGRQLAVAKVKKYQGENALVFVHPEDLQTQSIVRPEIVVINAGPEDFHQIEGGKLMPKREHTDRIGEACGIVFDETASTTRTEGAYTYIGHAAGKKRLPDGTWRTASAEYEYNVENRAREDYLKKPDKYNTEVAKEKHLLSLLRFARQKADSGARLRVIRQLAGIPTAFDRPQIQRAMVFCRIAVNTDRLMADPETRSQLIQGAIGAHEDLFGAAPEPRDVTPEPAQIEAPAEEAEADPWDLPPDTADAPPETSPEDAERMNLDEWVNSGLLQDKAVAQISAVTAKPDATLDELQALVVRCEEYKAKLDAKAAGGAA